MKTYRITNTTSGADLGTYEGDTPEDALDALARDAGYDNYSACCEDVPPPECGLRVEEAGADGETEEEAGRRIDEERNDRAAREINASARLRAAGVDAATCPEDVAAAIVGPVMGAALCRQARSALMSGYATD